jgi:TPR repeat protein
MKKIGVKFLLTFIIVLLSSTIWAEKVTPDIFDSDPGYLDIPPDFLDKVNAGDPWAQNELGEMYEIGVGVPEDDRKAVEWYKKAAEQGYADGQYNLGRMYEIGRGIPKNLKKAVELYKKAAEQGNADAQNDLGFAYEYGKGVAVDYKQALRWYQKALEQGVGATNLGTMYLEGKGVAKDVVTGCAYIYLAWDGVDDGCDELLNKAQKNAALSLMEELKKKYPPFDN